MMRKDSLNAPRFLVSGYGAPGQGDLLLCTLTADGAPQILSALCHGRAPSFCCQGENGWIYAGSERSDGADVTAYREAGGTLCETARLDVPAGRGLCHLYAHGGVVFGSCYENGLFFAADAALTCLLWSFQPANAHAHWTAAVENRLFLADLGNDCLYCFALQNDLPCGEPQLLPQPPGSGPRQLLAAGRQLCCVCELDGSLRLLNRQGEPVRVCAASRAPQQNWPGGACMGAREALFVCNRGPNTVAAWRVQGNGCLPLCEWPTGDWPRFAACLPGTSLLLAACSRSGTVHAYDCAALPAAPREVFCLRLPGASCVLPLQNAEGAGAPAR